MSVLLFGIYSNIILVLKTFVYLYFINFLIRYMPYCRVKFSTFNNPYSPTLKVFI